MKAELLFVYTHHRNNDTKKVPTLIYLVVKKKYQII